MSAQDAGADWSDHRNDPQYPWMRLSAPWRMGKPRDWRAGRPCEGPEHMAVDWLDRNYCHLCGAPVDEDGKLLT